MKKFFLLAATVAATMTASAQDFYMIGSNVNGHVWECGVEDCKFVNKGDGVYEWTGEILGTGFKINNGGWDNPDYNFGSNGEKVVFGEQYWYGIGGSTGNMDLDGIAEVINPVVTLNVEEGWILVAGEQGGETAWYITGTFCDYSFDYEMEKVEEGVYQYKGLELTEAADGGANEFKITTTGWGEQYGSPEEAPAEITPETLSAVLGQVGASNACPYAIFGSYDVTWDYNTLTVTFAPAGDSLVEGIAADEVEAVYYNLQGVKVANPVNGIYVKVMGKKATKVAVAK